PTDPRACRRRRDENPSSRRGPARARTRQAIASSTVASWASSASARRLLAPDRYREQCVDAVVEVARRRLLLGKRRVGAAQRFGLGVDALGLRLEIGDARGIGLRVAPRLREAPVERRDVLAQPVAFRGQRIALILQAREV